MLYRDRDKFADSTSEFINHLKHQLVVVVVNAVEEVLEFVNGHISDDLSKTFIRFGAFVLSARNLSVWIIIVVDLHSNVKSAGVIKVSVPVDAAPQNTHDGMQQRTRFAKIRNIYKLQDLNDL